MGGNGFEYSDRAATAPFPEVGRAGAIRRGRGGGWGRHEEEWGAGDMLASVPVLNPTPREVMLDARGRPYFLWDVDMTLDRFEQLLQEDDPPVRRYLIAKLMRQAKPDDVFSFVRPEAIAGLWLELEHDLGRTRPFWRWLLRTWGLIE